MFVPGTLDVRHPAAVVFLASVDEVADGPVFVEDLRDGAEVRMQRMLMYLLLSAGDVGRKGPLAKNTE